MSFTRPRTSAEISTSASLAEIRRARAWGVNDYDMAELTGIDRSLLTRYRRGEVDDPPHSKTKAILAVHAHEKRRQARLQKAAASAKTGK